MSSPPNLARANYTVLLIEAGDTSIAPDGQLSPLLTWDFFVKHYDETDLQMKHNKLVWKLGDGSYWVGPGRLRGAGELDLPWCLLSERGHRGGIFHDQRHGNFPPAGQRLELHWRSHGGHFMEVGL